MTLCYQPKISKGGFSNPLRSSAIVNFVLWPMLVTQRTLTQNKLELLIHLFATISCDWSQIIEEALYSTTGEVWLTDAAKVHIRCHEVSRALPDLV